MDANVFATLTGVVTGLWSFFRHHKRPYRKTSRCLIDALVTGTAAGLTTKCAISYAEDPVKNPEDLPFAVVFGTCAVGHEYELMDD